MKALVRYMLATLLVSAILPGCFISKRAALKNCEFRLADVNIKELALTYLRLELVIDVYNPNAIEVVVDRMKFDLYVNDERIASGTSNFKQKIASGESGKLKPVVQVNYTEVSTALLSAIKKLSAKYKVVGTVYFDTIVGTASFPVTIVEG